MAAEKGGGAIKVICPRASHVSKKRSPRNY